jgi:hypothetical protein
MYRILVRKNQFADKNITVLDVIRFIALRAEIETIKSVMLFII